MLEDELAFIHPLPDEPFAAALSEERLVGKDDRTIRWKQVRYSVPPGFERQAIWLREHGDHIVVAAQTEYGLNEIWRHERPVPARHGSGPATRRAGLLRARGGRLPVAGESRRGRHRRRRRGRRGARAGRDLGPVRRG
ncbi:Mu transposase domain-containing protein [Actinomadura harenae]|uniref:Mu transposase domain-containing protein n=1 Tax=Actinomadura harenae TaxID=2483351 RepID=UPI0011C43311|nr:hypothetical protein [Actinomadura harenae]